MSPDQPSNSTAGAQAVSPKRRNRLPRAGDRLPLGRSGLQVSPLCLGITGTPETVIAAFEEGINFFFLSADLHWPLYEATRCGLAKLLAGNKARRDELVIGVVSYLDEPLFQALQFHEVLDAVPGLARVDLLVAGAISHEQGFYPRVHSMENALRAGHVGARAMGGSFHQRPFALLAHEHDLLDIAYIRYNSRHPGARHDLLPHLRPDRRGLNYNFKSTMSRVTKKQFTALGFTDRQWLPAITDYYRFVLTPPQMDGMLCSPLSPAEVKSLVAALDQGPLSPDEEEYLILLSSLANPQIFD